MSRKSGIVAVIRFVAELLGATNQQQRKAVPAPRNQDPAENQSGPTAPLHVTVRSELHVPQAVIDAYSSSQKSTESRDKWRLRVETAALVFLIGTLVVGGCQTWLTRQQLDLIQSQLEATDRAWLSVSVEPASLTMNKDHVEATFDVTTTNTGRSPATEVSVVASMEENQPSLLDTIHSKQQTLCDRAQAFVDHFHGGDTVFPNANISNRFHSITEPMISGVLIGCVVYRYATSNRIHHTQFSYYVFRLDPQNPKGTLEFVPGDQAVKLIRGPSGSGHAN
jgi:hypothetical protein